MGFSCSCCCRYCIISFPGARNARKKNFLGNADHRPELVHVDFVDAGSVARRVFDPDRLCRTLSFDGLLLRHQKIKGIVLIFCAAVSLVSVMILPYTPAIQNQKRDAQSDDAVRGDDDLLQKEF